MRVYHHQVLKGSPRSNLSTSQVVPLFANGVVNIWRTTHHLGSSIGGVWLAGNKLLLSWQFLFLTECSHESSFAGSKLLWPHAKTNIYNSVNSGKTYLLCTFYVVCSLPNLFFFLGHLFIVNEPIKMRQNRAKLGVNTMVLRAIHDTDRSWNLRESKLWWMTRCVFRLLRVDFCPMVWVNAPCPNNTIQVVLISKLYTCIKLLCDNKTHRNSLPSSV